MLKRLTTMNRYYILFVLLICGNFVRSQSFNLIVNNGHGSGTYNEGDTVHVWANSVFDDTVFANWTGSGSSYLSFNNEWHPILIVPQGTAIGSLTINANFEALHPSTIIDSTSFLLFGEDAGVQSNVMKETFYVVPPSPKGLVFLLHGTGGKGESFMTRYERYVLVKDLVKDGYAVFTLDANERTMGDQNGDSSIRWDTSSESLSNSSNNVDILNVLSLRDSVISSFGLQNNIPSYTLGMSAGAVFSDICASALNFNASAHITAKGKPGTYTRPDIAPVIWIISENDNNISANNAIAYTNFSTMASTQVAEWHLFERSPVYPDRFERSLIGISPEQADSVYFRLQNSGYLDALDFLTINDVSLIPVNILDGLGLSVQQKSDIRLQLLCTNADHVLHSDYNKNIIRFFNDRLSSLNLNDVLLSEDMIILSPNPASNLVQIKFSAEAQSFKVDILNSQGILLRELKNELLINISTLPSGVYYLKITVDHQLFTRKLIVAR